MRQTTPRCVGPNALPGARLPEAPLPTALSMAATSLWVAVKRATRSAVAGDGNDLAGSPTVVRVDPNSPENPVFQPQTLGMAADGHYTRLW